jgi:predicted O-methyltransferase YrrM
MEGQLWPAERQFLFESVVEERPEIVLEIGTWKGGGSTMQIAKALQKNAHGKLLTCEPDEDCFHEASKGWWGHPLVSVFKMTSEEMISYLIETQRIPDFIFFDGPEDANVSISDFERLEPIIKSGSTFMMHDWDEPSIKAKIIRPHIEQSKKWKLIRRLTSPESVGICRYKKL